MKTQVATWPRQHPRLCSMFAQACEDLLLDLKNQLRLFEKKRRTAGADLFGEAPNQANTRELSVLLIWVYGMTHTPVSFDLAYEMGWSEKTSFLDPERIRKLLARAAPELIQETLSLVLQLEGPQAHQRALEKVLPYLGRAK